MLLTIHNFPAQTQYQDVKKLIVTKCGLEDAILDNLQIEGGGMRVTVGVSEEEDAAILVRKINGLFYGGQQLYVQNKRQKRESEQPYRSNVAQPQIVPQTQSMYDYSQVQAVGMFPAGQMNYMYTPQPINQAVQGVYMAYGQQQYSEPVMPQYAGPLNEIGNPVYDKGDFAMAQSKNMFARRDDALTLEESQAGPRWEERPPLSDDRRLPKDGPPQRFDGRQQRDDGFPQRYDGRPQRDDGRPQRDDGRPQRDDGRLQRHEGHSQRFDRRPQEDEGRPQRTDGRLQRNDGHPQRDDRGPQIYERRLQRDDRRRPASPFRLNRGQDTEPDPKRPKRDSRDERFSRNDLQGRFREERGSFSNSTRFDDRTNNSGRTRWDTPRDDQRPEFIDRREPPARIQRNDTEPDWKTWKPTGGQVKNSVSEPNQSSALYNEFGQGPTMPGHSPAKSNNFYQGPSKAGQGSATYNKFSFGSFITGQGSTATTFDQGSSMPGQGPTAYNKFNQGSSLPGPVASKNKFKPGPVASKNKFKSSTVADQHKIKFTDGTDKVNQGSTKFHKVKAKETIMSQIVTNANAKNILKGPSAFKNLLSKICSARIDDVVGTYEMLNDDIVRRYRSKYPATGDCMLYNDINKKLSERPTMNFQEMWDCALQFVPGGRKPAVFPPKSQPPVEKAKQPPQAAASATQPKPIGPFASKNKYEQCVGKLTTHVMYDMSKTLNIDLQLSETSYVRTLLRKAVAARVGDIVVNMTAAPAHILPHYRKRYPKKTDAELYADACKAAEHLGSLPAPGVATGAGTSNSGPVVSPSVEWAVIPLLSTKKRKKLSGAQKKRRAIERQKAIMDGLAGQIIDLSDITTGPELGSLSACESLPVNGMAIEDSGSLPAADVAAGAGTSDSGPVASLSVESAADPLNLKKKKRRKRRALEMQNANTDVLASQTTNPPDVSTGPEQGSPSFKEALPIDGMATEDSGNLPAATGAGTSDSGPVASLAVESAAVPLNPNKKKKNICGSEKRRRKRRALEMQNSITDGLSGQTTNSPDFRTEPEQDSPSFKQALPVDGMAIEDSGNLPAPDESMGAGTSDSVPVASLSVEQAVNPLPAKKKRRLRGKKKKSKRESFTEQTTSPSEITTPEQGSPSLITEPEQRSLSLITEPEQGSSSLSKGPEQGSPSLTTGPDQGSPSFTTGPEKGSPPLIRGPEQGSPSLTTGRDQGSFSLTTGPEQGLPSLTIGPEQGSPSLAIGPNQGSILLATETEQRLLSLTTGPDQGSPFLNTAPEQGSPSIVTGPKQRSSSFTTTPEQGSTSINTGPEHGYSERLTAQSIKDFAESTVIPSIPKPNKRAGGSGAAGGNKIPTHLQADKHVHMQQKKQHIQNLTTMTQSDMGGTFKQALDKEMEAISTLMQNILNNPETQNEKLIYGDMKKGHLVTECTKLIGHHISKRLTNSGQKLVRIYGYPNPPKRADLENFLCKNKFKCVSLKKSVKSPFYTAAFDSYEAVDALCNLPPVLIGNDIAVEFKYMHLFKVSADDKTKKIKMSKKARKNLVKKMVEDLIDKSKVNLLDKDWPAQEEAERKAKAEKNKEIEKSEDVIHVESEIKTIDITDDDDAEANVKINEKGSNVEHEFLNDEFRVIDEIRESEDDGPIEEKDKNEIGDDWDQTWDDWGDETGGGEIEGDKTEGVGDGDANGGDGDANGDDGDANGGDGDANGGDGDANGGDGDANGGDGDANGDDGDANGGDGEANEGDCGEGHDGNTVENNDFEGTDDEIDKVIAENAEDIDIADVEFDEDDLEDY